MIETIHWDEGRAQVIRNSEVRAYLMSQGLPAETLLFEADSMGAGPFVTASGQNLISIGAFDDDFQFFVDIDTGSVFFGLEADENPVHSNANLTFFVACIQQRLTWHVMRLLAQGAQSPSQTLCRDQDDAGRNIEGRNAHVAHACERGGGIIGVQC